MHLLHRRPGLTRCIPACMRARAPQWQAQVKLVERCKLPFEVLGEGTPDARLRIMPA